MKEFLPAYMEALEKLGTLRRTMADRDELKMRVRKLEEELKDWEAAVYVFYGKFERSLKIAEMFQFPTVAAMARHLSGDEETAVAVEDRTAQRQAAKSGRRERRERRQRS